MEWPHHHSPRSLADQRGQDAIEYAGVLVVIAAVITVVVLAVNTLGGTLAHDVECAISKIFGKGCSSAPVYPVSETIHNAGWNGRAVIVDGGHDYTLTLTKYSNGTATITADTSANLGVSAEVGAGVDVGPAGDIDATASAGVGGYGGQAMTWSFPNASVAQKYFNQISHGSGLGLASHDAASSFFSQALPFGFGAGEATHLWDKVTGSQGAPTEGTLPHKYLSSTELAAGAQGSAQADAELNAGPLSAGVSAALNAKAGFGRIGYGSQKGDYELLGGVNAEADGHLGEDLFGSEAEGEGNLSTSVKVLFSPSGKPEELEVEATGDGVWHVAPPSVNNVQLPDRVTVPSDDGGESGGKQSGGEPSGGEPSGSEPSEGGGGEKEPMLEISNNSAEGSGYGSGFSGSLDLQQDPQAEQDLNGLLEGNPTKIDSLINDMNSSGDESVWTYRASRSSSTYGGHASFVAGGAASVSTGNATLEDNPPEMRRDGGKWYPASQAP